MDPAIQLASNDKSFRDGTIQDLNYFKSQSSLTDAISGEKLVAMLRAVKKGFNPLGDEIMEFDTESKRLEVQKGDFDQNAWKNLERNI